MPLTHKRLTSLLDYDPTTGVFTWKVSHKNQMCRGMRAGYLHKKSGYRRIRVGGLDYNEHRLAMFYVNGAWPIEHVDHKRVT